jgi:hypothetical protein
MHGDRMIRRVAIAALAALGLAALPALPAHAREPGLWATINLCDPPAKPGSVGVRVSIPAHGTRKHRQQQWLRIRVQWYDGSQWQSLGDMGDTGYKHVGRGRGTWQGGTTFTFDPPAAGQELILRGVANVQWRVGRKVRGRAQLPTESGHANPKKPALTTSLATCQISR